MKKLIILPLLAIYLQANENRLAMVSEYQTMFSKIGEKRVGIDQRDIDAVKTPFMKIKKEQPKVVDGKVQPLKEVLTLQAIVNKRAKISGQWYGIGDELDAMKIVSIASGVVWLKNSEYKKRLIMRKENAKISIK